jgi:hypothetical protein
MRMQCGEGRPGGLLTAGLLHRRTTQGEQGSSAFAAARAITAPATARLPIIAVVARRRPGVASRFVAASTKPRSTCVTNVERSLM